jgi:UDP-GlcNAc:undecaprenyl-phosphate GlcNAc-1-phosphate transferase
MGDAGSLPIGYLIAILTIRTTYYHPEHNTQPTAVLIPLVILAIPLYDVASVVWIRWRSGKEIFRADHRHFSHRLVQRGMTPRTAVLTIYLATDATALGAIFLPKANLTTAVVILVQTLCILLIVALLERQSKHAKP